MRGIANQQFPVTYGYGKPSLKFKGKIHTAVDFGTPAGTVLFPMFDSRISAIGSDKYGSKYIQYSSGDLTIQYWHIGSTLRKIGEDVREGTAIALSGSSGAPGQPHTHVVAIRNGQPFDVRTLSVPVPSQPVNSYTVRSGDSLSVIASRNGISLSRLLDLNPKFRSNPNMVRTGEVILISSPLPSTHYVVKNGDTLSGIALRNNLTLNTLLINNPSLKSNPNKIYIGQRIKL